MDKNLNDDMLKLVRYKILFVKRGYEHAFPEQEDLVYDNMDETAFTAWKVAEFIQDLEKVRQESSEQRAHNGIRIPHAWGSYRGIDRYNFNGYLTGFPSEDKKYLRVYFEVLERFPRQKFQHDELQIEVLGQIRDQIADCKDGKQPGKAAPTTASPPDVQPGKQPSTQNFRIG